MSTFTNTQKNLMHDLYHSVGRSYGIAVRTLLPDEQKAVTKLAAVGICTFRANKRRVKLTAKGKAQALALFP